MAPKDSKPEPESDYLENLARILREIEEQADDEDTERPPELPN